MAEDKRTEEFYNKLREQLYDTASWPSEYLYKFIVKSELDKIAEIEALFDNMGAVINTVESKNGKYTSVSINLLMRDPDAVIGKIQGSYRKSRRRNFIII